MVIAKLHSSEMFSRGVTDLEIGYSEDKHGEFETTLAGPKFDLNGLREGLRELGFIFT